MKTRVFLKFTIAAFFILAIYSCGKNSLSFLSGKQSAYEKYSSKLDQSGLSDNVVGKSWLDAGEQSVQQPLQSEVPFAFSTLFRAKEIRAVAWEFYLLKGQSIKISLSFNSSDSSLVFADIFQREDLKNLDGFTSGDGIFSFESKKSQTYILRVQPELFAEGNLSLKVEKQATYAVFPIYGKDAGAVQSFWGAPRDGGGRKHEGIDIFAARGTPVLAPVDGMVTSVRDRGLGGKQVWYRDSERGFNLYFAHLDTQLVIFGQGLKAGDTLGLVGNTGNARYTSPHLHFGIYSNGAFDPFPMVNNKNDEAKLSELSVDHFVMTVKGSKANFRDQPTTKSNIIETLNRGTPLVIMGAMGDWYLIKTPDSKQGYIHSSLVGTANTETLSADKLLVWANPFKTEISDSLVINEELGKVGEYNGYVMLIDELENVYYTQVENHLE